MHAPIEITEDCAMIDGPENLTNWRRRLNMRWLAVGAGLALVPPCFGITLFYLAMPVMLIAGAAIVGGWPRIGRWLMWIGASLLSLLVFPWCIAILLHPGGRVDFMVSACLASAILLPLCDLALLLDAFKGRGGKRLHNLSGV